MWYTNSVKRRIKMKNCKCGCKVRNTCDNQYSFTKDSTIGEVLNANEKLKTVLEGFGMHCFGCPMSQLETLEEASEVHEIDLDFMLEKLNNFKD